MSGPDAADFCEVTVMAKNLSQRMRQVAGSTLLMAICRYSADCQHREGLIGVAREGRTAYAGPGFSPFPSLSLSTLSLLRAPGFAVSPVSAPALSREPRAAAISHDLKARDGGAAAEMGPPSLLFSARTGSGTRA
jgi:hypothetical protein